jgi:hypothetical protein
MAVLFTCTSIFNREPAERKQFAIEHPSEKVFHFTSDPFILGNLAGHTENIAYSFNSSLPLPFKINRNDFQATAIAKASITSVVFTSYFWVLLKQPIHKRKENLLFPFHCFW